MKAVCPGSFDPVTHGHLDVVARAAACFDEVVVGVGQNTSKNYLFAPQERLEMVAEACAAWPKVSVAPLTGLLVDFCAEHDAQVIVKGLRFASDFDFELQQAQMNKAMTGIETVLLPTSAQWGFVSSTLIREIALLGGPVAQFVPDDVARRIQRCLSERPGRS